jgi:hypothetical protein
MLEVQGMVLCTLKTDFFSRGFQVSGLLNKPNDLSEGTDYLVTW